MGLTAARPLRRQYRVILAAILVAARPGAAETPPRGESPETLPPVTAGIVRVDVVVTEKGRPKEALTRENFVVLESMGPSIGDHDAKLRAHGLSKRPEGAKRATVRQRHRDPGCHRPVRPAVSRSSQGAHPWHRPADSAAHRGRDGRGVFRRLLLGPHRYREKQ
jgi:hypothetical protein